MFTGLVREVGRLWSQRSVSGLTVLDITAPKIVASGLAIGDSLAVNGICLTITTMTADRVRVDASAETRRVTTLADWRVGQALHLEPALRSGDPLGGHFVLGHVDGIGQVARIRRERGTRALSMFASPALRAQLVPKGSIAVDGVSLTLDDGPFDRTFTVTIVPHTLRETRFDTLRAGDRVNLEIDILSKAAMAGAARDARPATHQTIGAILARGWSR